MMFLRKLALSVAALALFQAGPALAEQQKHPTPVANAKAAAPAGMARPALWKVSDPDTTIYLFGTIHALPGGINWFEGPVAKAFNASEALVTEIPEADPAAMQGTVMKLAALPRGESLRTMLSAKDNAALDKALKDLSLPKSALDQFEPWFVAVTLGTMPLLRNGYSAENGIEMQLQNRAKAAKRPHLGLETVEFQLGIFDSLPRKKQVTYLRQVIKGLPKFKQQLDGMVKYWSTGNATRLGQMINADQSDPALMKALLSNRNRNWTGWIRNRLDQPGTVFVAVGAGHLAGRDSVQAMLKKRGIKVTRVQ
ncbi:TraB/GumN family protein [Novosphingobium sp. TH158]|uniref:TraB/GumN family protein n=1 Tax=Novosphingobium sp. TH158 TaxID=2067455 RepID=UPI000C7C4BCB|nr:TraB/GumN family protein [Novosphingobium sp. TH158]PLK25932.1 TraB/GumN family protein [Novosphingobium sp. TH158]